MSELKLGFKFVAVVAYELQRVAISLLRDLQRRGTQIRSSEDGLITRRFSKFAGKRLVANSEIGFTGRQVSWFYTGFDRDSQDPLTNGALRWIQENIAKNDKILVTGCGVGLMAFHLAESGFSKVEGRDLLKPCIDVANKLKEQYAYTETEFKVDNGFFPVFGDCDKYGLITALHWVFSAWSGNYGNPETEDPTSEGTRVELLDNFLRNYSQQLVPGGILIIELTDAVADYRDPKDHPMGHDLETIYPVRHSPDMVKHCADKNGLEVLHHRMTLSYGHQPRTAHYLQKK